MIAAAGRGASCAVSNDDDFPSGLHGGEAFVLAKSKITIRLNNDVDDLPVVLKDATKCDTR